MKAEAVHNGSTGAPLSILDDGLVERIHSVFSLHPWVAKVQRVTKSHPAHVEVEIVYRRPVAMVEVPGGWYPVDVEGVLLPINDFSPTDHEFLSALDGRREQPDRRRPAPNGAMRWSSAAQDRREPGHSLERTRPSRKIRLGEADCRQRSVRACDLSSWSPRPEM